MFDNLRADKTKKGAAAPGKRPSGPAPRLIQPGVLESWETPTLWGTWVETATQEGTQEFVTAGKQGLKLSFDLEKFPHPLLYASLNPGWDLSQIKSLALDVFVPAELADTLMLNLVLEANVDKYRAPPVPLKAGRNQINIELKPAWLPDKARTGIEQVQLVLTARKGKPSGHLIFDNFRSF